MEESSLLPLLGSGPTACPPGSGYFTVQDYQEILMFAAERHIEVIPEIDMPGHCHAAIRAMQVIKLSVFFCQVIFLAARGWAQSKMMLLTTKN